MHSFEDIIFNVLLMKKVYVVLLFMALACGTFLMPFEKNANAQLCGKDTQGVCRVSGSTCYCLLDE